MCLIAKQWLAFCRLNTRDNTTAKTWTFDAGCDICPALESIDHIILHCRPSHWVWDHLGLAHIAARSNAISQFVMQVLQLPSSEAWPICFAACAVILWCTRNRRVFDHENSSRNLILRRIADELRLWISGSTKLRHQIPHLGEPDMPMISFFFSLLFLGFLPFTLCAGNSLMIIR